MKLDFSLIATALCGAVGCEEIDGGIIPRRFTEAELEAYHGYSDDFYLKAHAAAGIRLEFSTDSQSLTLSGECRISSSRCFYAFDVYVDGALVHHSLAPIADGRTEFRIDASLGDKREKKVKIYFPWSAEATIREMTLDDGASFSPVRYPRSIICYGDSITHGYDAKNPSFSYASRLADMLCAEHINKGIGGEVFFPTLAELCDAPMPDLITVAYGTNDWSKMPKADFDRDSRLFYDALARKFRNTKIFAISPIWRINCETRITDVGSFDYVRETLCKIADGYENVIFIDGFDLVPHSEDNFAPDILHPNDAGFYHYAANLYSEIKKHI